MHVSIHHGDLCSPSAMTVQTNDALRRVATYRICMPIRNKNAFAIYKGKKKKKKEEMHVISVSCINGWGNI